MSTPAAPSDRTALRLVFMGSPDFSVPTLDALLDAGHQVLSVYCQPPRPAGRGQKERLAPVHRVAEQRGLTVRTPKTLRDAAEQERLTALAPDVIVVIAYGLILPQAVLDIPRLGCVNVHASLLPRWRGAAPIQRAIEAGDQETGITIMRMDAGLDTGDMLLWESLPIPPDMIAGELHDRLAAMGGPLLLRALEGLAAGTLSPIPQPAAGITYAEKLSKDESRLDWSQSATVLARKIRAFSPWPGCWFDHGGDRIKLLGVTVDADDGCVDAVPGTVLDDGLRVACGEGVLRLTRLQRAGKAPMEVSAFLRGYALAAGATLR